MYNKDVHIELLEATNNALALQLVELKKRKMARNNEAAEKYRRSAYYFKTECKRLQTLIKMYKLEEESNESIHEQSS